MTNIISTECPPLMPTIRSAYEHVMKQCHTRLQKYCVPVIMAAGHLDSRGTSYQPCQPETQMETSKSDSGMYKLVCIYMPVTSIFNTI
jgi:hypothetical protein